MHFSGTTDGAVPTLGTQRWIKELNWPISHGWSSYKVDGQIAGFYEKREKGTFVFATVHGAGHMAAQWKRKETYHLIKSFVQNSDI